MLIRKYESRDWNELLRLTLALFPEYNPAVMADGIRAVMLLSGSAIFVAERPNGLLAGYVQAGTREYADGCDTSPVGYIEEWYVDEDVRRSGIGHSLLRAAEEWARRRGYSEMASDALLDNDVSHMAHEAAGYREVERAVHFRKAL